MIKEMIQQRGMGPDHRIRIGCEHSNSQNALFPVNQEEEVNNLGF